MSTFLFNKKLINYRISGKGTTIVLLHGFMENMEMWSDHVDKLSLKYRIVCIDLPGHGLSESLEETHSMDLMANVVYKILEFEGIEKCIVIGHSMGGYVALAFADHFSNMLIGFGLFHSHTLEDTEEIKQNRMRTVKLINEDKGNFILQFIPSLYKNENRERLILEINKQIEEAKKLKAKTIISALMGMKDRPSRLDVIAFAKFPVLFVLGKHDSRIPIDSALAQAATASTCQIIILGNSGHMGWLEEPSKTISAIDGFVQLCDTIRQ
jgi:pimeloyl-ACP methyl ester carboxylesterase